MIRFIDLFAGIGGIRLGVESALRKHGIEYECVLSSEIDEKACETYQLNFGEYPQGDIKKITKVKPFDLLLAGFPCQPFSYAGKRLGFGDTRGTLFFEVERLLSAYSPKAFLLENVRGLYTHDGGRTFSTIMEKLHRLGYGTYDLLLNSSDFAVPQNRVRLYILGIKGSIPKMTLTTNLGAADTHVFKRKLSQYSLFDKRNKIKTVREILESQVDEKYYCSDRFVSQLKSVIGEDLSALDGYRLIDYRGGQSIHSWELGTKGKCSPAEIKFMNTLIQNRRKPEFGRKQDGKKLTIDQIKTFYKDQDMENIIESLVSKKYLKQKDGKYDPVSGNMSFEIFKFLDPNSVSITLTSADSNRLGVVQNNKPRHITPRECARIQGFPDSFVVNPNDNFSYKQFGNSVSVPVIEAVFSDFLDQNLDCLGWKDFKYDKIQQPKQELKLSQLFDEAKTIINKKKGELEKGQGRLLSIILENGSMTMRDLRRAAGITAGSLSEMVNALVEKGFVIRKDSKKDKRTKILILSKKGVEFCMKNISSSEISPFSALNDNEKIIFGNLLNKIVVANK